MAKFISDEDMAKIESQSPPPATGAKPRFISDEDMAKIPADPVKPDPSDPHDTILGIPVSTIEGSLNALPMAGALAGGTVGLGAGGPVGAVAGGGLGAAGGEALANAIRAGIGLKSAPQTRAEVYSRPAIEGLKGAAAEGAGQALAKVPGLIKATPGAVKDAAGSVKRVLSGKPKIPTEVLPAAQFEDIAFVPSTKANAGEIQAATKRIAQAEATPGMVSANQNIQNLENVLGQSPTIAGERVRSAYDPIQKGLKKSAEELAGSPALTPFEAGQQFKSGLTQKIQERVQPLSSQFDKIREASRHIKPEPQSLGRAADRLLRQDMAEFANLPQGQAIQKYAGMIREAKTLDSLKQLRSSVGDEIGKALDSGDGQLAMALGKVKGTIQRVERREILKAAIAATPTKQEGAAAAKDLIGEIKSVNKGWRALMTELQQVASAGGIKKIESPKHLARIIDDMPSEKIAERFFNTKNYQGLRDVKQHLPDEFEVLRQSRLGQIAEKSLTKGEPDPAKLIRNLKGIGKESRELLFGKDGEQVLRDMETVVNSMPSKVGASDTPRGMAWHSLLKPSRWANEAQSAYSYMLLSGRTVKNSSSQKTIGMLPRAAGYGAVGVVSNQNERGQDRWARSGLSKLNVHAGTEVFNEDYDVRSASPQLRTLLIQASDLTPGSKAMDNVLAKIKALKKGGS